MWPDIERKNGIGVKFDEKFWDMWGPSSMCYFNPELFNDEKKIKSIYCMYLQYNCIEFKPDEIAMGLHYECGDFGQHTVLFSYEEIPDIKHSRVWDYCVFENLVTDNPEFINLHNYIILKQQGKMSEEDVYMNFLEDYILDDDIDKTFFRDLCDNILKSYIKNNPSVTYEEAYKRFLENICQRISGNSEQYILLKSIRDCCREKSDEFDRIILEIIKQTQICPNKMHERYQRVLAGLEKMKIENNLDSIFRNCRELFVDKVVRYSTYEEDEEKYDIIKHEFVNTGRKIEVIKADEGSVEKDENGKAVFKERKLTEPQISNRLDKDDWLL